MVAARGEERGLRPELRHEPEAEHVAVERDGVRDVGDLQVHVPHHRPFGKQVERGACGVLELPQEAAGVEREGRHPRADLALPDLARPVPVHLDPVPVRVGEIDRLAHEVVGEPRERDPLAGHVREPGGEVDPLGEEQREVVETGVAVRGPRTGLLHEHEQLALPGGDRRAAVVAGELDEPERLPVEGERALEVGDGEMDRAHRGPRRDLGARRRTDHLELLGIAGRVGHGTSVPCGFRLAAGQRARRKRAPMAFRSAGR